MKQIISKFKTALIITLANLLISTLAFSQAPEKMSYQSVLRGTNNALVTNQNVRVKISILQGAITGSAAYVEEHNTSTNSNGLVSLSIGGGTLISGNFSTINWANGPYFIKMEADPTGGTNYTISGTTQLLSVPYALHAKTAESVVGGSSLESGTQIGNTTYWNGTKWVTNSSNLFNNGSNVAIGTSSPNSSAAFELASSNKGFLPPRMTLEERNQIVNPADGLMIFNTSIGCPNYFFAGLWYELCGSTGMLLIGSVDVLSCSSVSSNGTIIQGIQLSSFNCTIPYSGGNGGFYNSQTISSTGVTGLTATLPQGMLANGSGSLILNISGTPSSSGSASFELNVGGQTCVFNLSVLSNTAALYPTGSVFCNGPTEIVDVTNPITGKTWMDRNLGASQVATSSTDEAAYGDLYQWGRAADGHQCRNSATTATLSSTDQPGHGNFITTNSSPFDWRSPQNTNLWQGVNGVNNPCPNGYRLPTETELNTERASWSINTSVGAFLSALKLPMAGWRDFVGSLRDMDANGSYWSNNVDGVNVRLLFFINGSGANFATGLRADGYSVRCIKN
jgi:uncharacterized protein (TIGR02145 family)